jgi:hypothetical protein
MSDNYNNNRKEGGREEIYSKRVSAGKRTYFFDVKATKSNDYYITITESKKRMGDDGTPFYEKHKVFIYREDFEKFVDGLTETVTRINELKKDTAPAFAEAKTDTPKPDNDGSSFSDVSFEDLK